MGYNASTPSDKKQKLQVGDELVLGKDDLNNTWQVLDIDDSEALLINKDYVRILSYDGLESHYCSHLGHGAHMAYPYIAIRPAIRVSIAD